MLHRVKRIISAIRMISQEDCERVEMQAFEREVHAIAQSEEGSIEEKNLVEGKIIFIQKDIVTNVWHSL